jgi:hypothetical protein
MMSLLKHYRTFATLLIAFALLATLAACATPSTGNGGGSGSPTATTAPAPTATPKPKPTGVPTITTALCQQLMTVDEANTLMQPSIKATKILADSSEDGGSCNYQATPTDYPLIIYFLDWNGPNPIPQSDIAAALAQGTNSEITINNATPVSGIGDQAEYVEASATFEGQTGVIHIFYVLYGKMFFDCFTFNALSGGAEASQSQLQTCATQVVNRL